MTRKLISSDEAVQSPVQHRRPCSDCPFARAALNGWLGDMSVDEWIQVAHTDSLVECHVINNQQCAGLAIYRRNVLKRVDDPLLVLPADKELVFATPMEFREHHSKMPPLPKPKRRRK